MGYRDYSVAKGHIVDVLGHGDFTTIQAAVTAASSGQTIFIRPGTYTENVTLKAGIDIVAFITDDEVPNVTINGTLSFSEAGSVGISGIQLQTNSAPFLTVSGSAASVVYLNDCFLNCLNNTGISYTSSSSSSIINITDCSGNIATTGITFYTMSSPGSISGINVFMRNSGATTTASSNSAGIAGFSDGFLFIPLSASSSGNIVLNQGFINSGNTTCITLTGTSVCSIHEACSLAAGSASALNIGSGCQVTIFCIIECFSSNANAITGAGTIQYGLIVYTGSSSTNNVTTQVALPTQPAIPSSSGAVVQQVRTSTSTNATFTTTYALGSIPTTSGGTQFLSQAITPTNSSHILLIEYEYFAGISAPSSATDSVISGIFQDSTTNALYAQVDINIGAISGGLVGSTSVKGRYFMTAGTTSATTFKVRLGVTGGTGYFLENPAGTTLGGVQFASLTITEYTS